MTRKLMTGATALSLCLGSAAPAIGQERHFSGLDGPAGASATINLRIPLGHRAERARPSVGLTVGYGRRIVDGSSDSPPVIRQVRVADLRFNSEGLARAEVATFDLANLGQDARINPEGNKKNMLLLFVMIIAGATALAFVVNGHDRREPESEETPESPGLG
jgi:hypothetical protein